MFAFASALAPLSIDLPALRARLAGCLPDLTPFEKCHGGLRVMAVCEPDAPISWWAEPAGAAMVLGDAIETGSPRRLEAERLFDLWQGEKRPQAWDGFHLLLKWDETESVLLAGVDRLGIFPLYYLDLEGVVAISTSPTLLRTYPGYEETFDEEGLAGFLMTRATYGGRTLSKTIKRLEPGMVVRLSLHERPREVFQWAPTPYTAADGWKAEGFDQHLEAFHEAFAEATQRHLAACPDGFQLLSGGIDSRMVAGLLSDQGKSPPAVVFGRFWEIEARAAKSVASELGRSTTRIVDPYDRHAVVARWVVEWEDLGAGFFFFLAPLLLEPGRLRHLGKRIFTGLQLDSIAGGGDVEPDLIPTTVEDHLVQNWGLGWKPDELRWLLRPSMRGAVDAVLERAREAYRAAPADPYQRTWLLGLPLRDRHHVGINAWRASFSRWPVLLSLDEKVLRTCMSIPLSSAADRALQKQLIIRRWPGLARLPLDRNDFSSRPLLVDGKGDSWEWTMRIRRRLHQHLGIETRFYHQMSEMDKIQWKQIRSLAEPGRESLHEWFEPSKLAEVLPPPGIPMPPVRDKIADSIRIKNLLGLMMRGSPAKATLFPGG